MTLSEYHNKPEDFPSDPLEVRVLKGVHIIDSKGNTLDAHTLAIMPFNSAMGAPTMRGYGTKFLDHRFTQIYGPKDHIQFSTTADKKSGVLRIGDHEYKVYSKTNEPISYEILGFRNKQEFHEYQRNSDGNPYERGVFSYV